MNATMLKTTAMMCLLMLFGTSPGVWADEADAKRILQSMSDFVGSQEFLSFDYDASLEVITLDDQKLALVSSGSVRLDRPDKIHATRFGGFADVEMLFDGKVLTLVGKNLNLYTQLAVPGSINHLVDELKDTYNRPLPAADLLLEGSYDELMLDVVDIKDLGSAVVGGVECDYLAFRTKEVDWQIWVAHGDRPYPCRYVITSKLLNNAPQYSVQTSNWKTGEEVAKTTFNFTNPTDADQVELEDLKGAGDLPEHFVKGDSK